MKRKVYVVSGIKLQFDSFTESEAVDATANMIDEVNRRLADYNLDEFPQIMADRESLSVEVTEEDVDWLDGTP